MKTALLFPGQGSQKVGMGQKLALAFSDARAVFDEADAALGYSISKICFSGPDDALTLTENTQPAILTTSIAALRAAEKRIDLSFDVAAGHSLGEWSALVATGALSFADAVRLVHLRGKAMQEAVPQGTGAMAAVLGLDADALRALCAEVAQGEICQPANFNGGGQIVISGHKAAVDRAVAKATGQGARAVPLTVSAPFHCALMQAAADRVQAALADVTVNDLKTPVVSNIDAKPYRQAGEVRERLVKQVTGAVLWEQSVLQMKADGVTRAFEIGQGGVLRGLCRRIDRDLKVTCIAEPGDLENTGS